MLGLRGFAMIDFSSFGLTPDFWSAMGGLFFCWVIAKFTATESRTLLAAIVAVAATDSPAAFYVVGVFAIIWKLFDIWKVSI